MNVESSRVIVSLTDAGSALRTDANFFLMPSITAMVFSPVARTISRLHRGRAVQPGARSWGARTRPRHSRCPDTRIGVPLLVAMTMLLN